MTREGIVLLEHAIFMRNRRGTKAAALWMEKHGLSFEIGIIALVGSVRARSYGVHVARICQRGWNR